MKRSIIIILCLSLTTASLPAQDVSAEEPDHMTAFFLSFMIPGLGHWYAGSPGSAKMFIASELAIWAGYYYTTEMKESYGNDYLSFAATHAGISPSVNNATYLSAISSYDSSFEYNRQQEQFASPDFYDGTLAWEWDSYDSRDHFKELRERELDFENYAKYCVAGVVLNHFLAGLNASKLVREKNTSNSGLTIRPTADSVRANYRWSF